MRILTVCAALSLLSAPAGAAQWTQLDEGKTGERSGSMLVWAPDLRQFLLAGSAKDAPFLQAFDPTGKAWSEVSADVPAKGELGIYYQTAYDPGTKTLYCLAGGTVLYAFSLPEKTWRALPAAPELEGMSWQTLACDPAGKRLVVAGADKKADNLGWMRTVVHDIPSGKWTRLQPDEKVTAAHRDLVAGVEATIELAGRIRMAWYRDPAGVGTDEERKALGERAAALKKLPGMEPFAADADGIAGLLAGRKMLDALAAARAVQRKLEEAAEAQYPVPCSRRNSPLVYDEKDRVFVLFGGDHENYLMNDTWVLDLALGAWRRARPAVAPSPRAGHTLAYLPKSGRIALYEGYVQSSSTDYGATPYAPLNPVQLWLYDVKAEHWDLAGSWPLSKDAAGPAPVGFFWGYAGQYFSPPALAAGPEDNLVLASPGMPNRKRPAQTWTMPVDAAQADAAGRDQLSAAPNTRLYRTGPFLAGYCEVPDAPPATGLEKLPDNQWVKLPPAPRNPCRGCRQRDWGTVVWDSDRDQMLLWGGGHCVRSDSPVAHWSPASGRIVEGYDADEPYGANGGGGFDSSLLNRPWISTHNYKHYAYDPNCKLLVSARGYLYDPARMDWLRLERLPLPYRFEWGSTAVAASAHGAVTWARQPRGDGFGLWLFDREKGWTDLEPQGAVGPTYCDANGLVYDPKRDRMILSGVGGGYAKISSGQLQAYDFKTKALETVTPENLDLGKTNNAREMAYVEHADWVLIGDHYVAGDPQTGKHYTRVYDCAKNKYFLLDSGPEVAPGGYGAGWVYDAKRKLVYALTTNGDAWALKIVPATAKLLEKPE